MEEILQHSSFSVQPSLSNLLCKETYFSQRGEA